MGAAAATALRPLRYYTENWHARAGKTTDQTPPDLYHDRSELHKWPSTFLCSSKFSNHRNFPSIDQKKGAPRLSR